MRKQHEYSANNQDPLKTNETKLVYSDVLLSLRILTFCIGNKYFYQERSVKTLLTTNFKDPGIDEIFILCLQTNFYLKYRRNNRLASIFSGQGIKGRSN